MSYANFKQTFWSRHIQQDLKAKAILTSSCWQEVEGEIKYGNQVKILGVGAPTIKEYTGKNIGDPEDLEDTSVMLTIDQARYFNFGVDDVDKAQSVEGLMEKLLDEATQKMQLDEDYYIAGRAKEAKAFSGSLKIDTPEKAKKAVDDGILALRENNVSMETDVVIEICPFIYLLLKDKYIDQSTNNTEMLKKGIIGKYDGADVRLANNLYFDGTDFYNMIRTKKAIAFAGQIEKVEPYRPEGYFKDAIKGLRVYGAKVIRPKELYVIKAHK